MKLLDLSFSQNLLVNLCRPLTVSKPNNDANAVAFSVTSSLYNLFEEEWKSHCLHTVEHIVSATSRKQDIHYILSVYMKDLLMKKTQFVVFCYLECLQELLSQVCVRPTHLSIS